MKWILRYLCGIVESTLCFRKLDLGLQGYVDANMASDIDGKKSTMGYVYTLDGTIVSWVSKLQKIVALSTIEARVCCSNKD